MGFWLHRQTLTGGASVRGSQVPRKTFQPRCDAARLLDLARAGPLLADLDRLLGERPFLTEAV